MYNKDSSLETGKAAIIRIVERIGEESISQDFITKHKMRDEDFSRHRDIEFGDVINSIIGKSGTSLDFEIKNYFKDFEKSVTSSAFCQARDKVNYTAFEELFKETSTEIPVKRVFKGYRLKAYDGMKGEMPKRKELRKKYAITLKKLQFHAVAEYDVLNRCYTNAIFEGGTTDERACAIKMIKEQIENSDKSHNGKEILIFDRGFPSLGLIQLLSDNNIKYVMRVSKNFLKEVNEFGLSNDKDKTVTIKCDQRRCSRHAIKNVVVPYEVDIRCVKIKLKTGETELLMTNLEEQEFTWADLKKLYNLRWKIETGFLHLKHAVHVEDFISVKENGIKQEFFATLICTNIFMQFINISDTIIKNKKKRIRNTNIKQMSVKL